MKKCLPVVLALWAILGLLVLFSVTANAADIRVEWDAIADPSWGVSVYWDTDPAPPYANTAAAGINATGYTIKNAVPGETYYLSAKCYDPASGEFSEAYSSEINYTLPPFSVPELLLPDLGGAVREYRMILRVEAL